MFLPQFLARPCTHGGQHRKPCSFRRQTTSNRHDALSTCQNGCRADVSVSLYRHNEFSWWQVLSRAGLSASGLPNRFRATWTICKPLSGLSDEFHGDVAYCVSGHLLLQIWTDYAEAPWPVEMTIRWKATTFLVRPAAASTTTQPEEPGLLEETLWFQSLLEIRRQMEPSR